MAVSAKLGGPSFRCPFHENPLLFRVYIKAPDFRKFPSRSHVSLDRTGGGWGEGRSDV